MKLADLMQSITNKSVPHFLILYGDEQAILNIYINQIEQVLNQEHIIQDNIKQVLNKATKKNLDKAAHLYVVNEDLDYIKSEAAWERVKQVFTDKSKHYLILRYTSIDKRSAFYKRHSNIVEFTHLSDDILISYIQRSLPDLNEKNSSKLVEYCNHDYGRILMEVDKIKQWKEHNTDDEGAPPTDSVFKLLDKQGLFHKEIGDITFELTDAVLGGYPETAIQKLDEAKRKGEPAMMIASILYNGFRNLLAYQGLGTNKQGAMERTGMTKGELYGCTKNVGGYSISEVKRNMLICQKVESGIKMGTIDEDIALEYVVLSCLK